MPTDGTGTVPGGLGARWTDLTDPDREELEKAAPSDLHPRALDLLLAPARHDDEPRPTLEGHGQYVFGVFLVAVAEREMDEVFYQEVDLLLTREAVVTVRKTPDGRQPYDVSGVKASV